jgi:DNA-binding response OmpR family regulator
MDARPRGTGGDAGATIRGVLLLPEEPASPRVLALFCERVDDACLSCVRDLAQEPDAIVLVFYSDGSSEDEVRALEAGADDCLRLSFSAERLRARLLTLASRRPAATAPGPFGLVVNTLTFQASLEGRRLRLSPQEFRLLAELWRRRGRVVPYESLQRTLYGDSGPVYRQALRQLVHRLRARLGRADCLVAVVPGVGYVLDGGQPITV